MSTKGAAERSLKRRDDTALPGASDTTSLSRRMKAKRKGTAPEDAVTVLPSSAARRTVALDQEAGRALGVELGDHYHVAVIAEAELGPCRATAGLQRVCGAVNGPQGAAVVAQARHATTGAGVQDLGRAVLLGHDGGRKVAAVNRFGGALRWPWAVRPAALGRRIQGRNCRFRVDSSPPGQERPGVRGPRFRSISTSVSSPTHC